ncbi:uncharacterized protein AMSG_12275 [Thecamonas trahens ATCC 50062]|uniref:SRCR domain-containing protein n=1 Tax=Thecamonas trahens ATCC 50062 TaxID=461836 RepID=A0A0L0DPH0_THETB|nr:hypothetical protein AMSG_12275 [Thecamonas trahens ATCC 50062]KNC53921.1 hypothetical protein AMSG_12275 [Thecamonas trahens ATCC 50062]|eukprot:XP_013754202.1 hypothetical protein AMSG_12275 [Thecamonas trahens ATCC 50062]
MPPLLAWDMPMSSAFTMEGIAFADIRLASSPLINLDVHPHTSAVRIAGLTLRNVTTSHVDGLVLVRMFDSDPSPPPFLPVAVDLDGWSVVDVVVPSSAAIVSVGSGPSSGLLGITIPHAVSLSGSSFASSVGVALYAGGAAHAASLPTAVTDCSFSQLLMPDPVGSDLSSAVVALDTDLTVAYSTFTLLTSKQGPALFSHGFIDITASSFAANSASSGSGGAITLLFGASLRATTTIFVNNSALASSAAGGAISANSSPMTSEYIELGAGCVLEGNSATNYGGAVNTQLPLIVAADVVFIHNSAGYHGGAVRAAHTTVLHGGVFISNTANYGGGIFTLTSSAVLSAVGARFESNTALYSGGAISAGISTTLTLDACVFEGNAASMATGKAGAVRLLSTLSRHTIINSTFTGNAAAYGGALALEPSADVAVLGGHFVANSASLFGGAITATSAGLVIVDAHFDDNTATAIGGALEIGSMLPDSTVVNSTFVRHSAGSAGGTIYVGSGAFVLDHIVVTDSVSANSGALFANADITISGSIFSSCSSSSDGGAISAGTSAVVSIYDSILSHNTAVGSGGAISSYGELSIVRSVVSGNSAGSQATVSGNVASIGGGMRIDGNATLVGSILVGNTALTTSGGSIHAHGSHLELIDCVIRDSSAAMSGGGIHVKNSYTVLVDVVVESNTADKSSGLRVDDVAFGSRLVRTVIRSNTALAGMATGAVEVVAAQLLFVDSAVCANAASACTTNVVCISGGTTPGLANGCGAAPDACLHGRASCSAVPLVPNSACTSCKPGWTGPSCDVRTHCNSDTVAGAPCSIAGTTCTSCEDGYAFSDATHSSCALCQHGQFYEGSTQPCGNCAASCATCHGTAINCTSCGAGWNLVGNSCVLVPSPPPPPPPSSMSSSPPPPPPVTICPGNDTVDECGMCSGPVSGHVAGADKDVCGVCFGDGSGCGGGSDGSKSGSGSVSSSDMVLAVGFSVSGMCVVVCVLGVGCYRRRAQVRAAFQARDFPTRETKMPGGHVALLATEVQSVEYFASAYPEAMTQAMADHDALINSVAWEHEGYVAANKNGCFLVAFPESRAAFLAAISIQRGLFELPWPAAITSDDRLISDGVLWNGLRVRIGLRVCKPAIVHDATSGGMVYSGRGLTEARLLCGAANGGQIVVDDLVAARVSAGVMPLGLFVSRDMPDWEVELFQAKVVGLRERDHPAELAGFERIGDVSMPSLYQSSELRQAFDGSSSVLISPRPLISADPLDILTARSSNSTGLLPNSTSDGSQSRRPVKRRSSRLAKTSPRFGKGSPPRGKKTPSSPRSRSSEKAAQR